MQSTVCWILYCSFCAFFLPTSRSLLPQNTPLTSAQCIIRAVKLILDDHRLLSLLNSTNGTPKNEMMSWSICANQDKYDDTYGPQSYSEVRLFFFFLLWGRCGEGGAGREQAGVGKKERTEGGKKHTSGPRTPEHYYFSHAERFSRCETYDVTFSPLLMSLSQRFLIKFFL